MSDYTAALCAALAQEGAGVVLATAGDHHYPDHDGVVVRGVFGYLRGGSWWRDLLRRVKVHKIYNGLSYLLAYARLTRAARQADVVHVQGFDTAPLVCLAFLWLRLIGARLVHTPHNTFERGGAFGPFHELMAHLPLKVIVHAQADVPALPARVRRRAVVIPHGEYGALAAGGGLADRVAARRDLGLHDGDCAVLVFGQLRADKGIEDVLAAARTVPGLHVVLAGEELGALAGNASLIGDPALVGRVHIRRGFQTMEQAASLFAACDATVMAYRHASASGVLLLSYAFSRPVVAYPVGGLPEAVVDGETGWLCAEPTLPALAVTLREVLAAGEAERLRRGAAGRAFSAEHFAWDVIARRTLDVYASVAA